MNMDNDRLFRQTYMHCQLANSMHNHMNEAATGRISNGRKEAVPGGTVWGKESFFFSSRRRHTWWNCDWSSDVCSSDLPAWPELSGCRRTDSPLDAPRKRLRADP